MTTAEENRHEAFLNDHLGVDHYSHQHSYAMCVHGDNWHAACATRKTLCPDDHYAFGFLEPIACDLCGQRGHLPINHMNLERTAK